MFLANCKKLLASDETYPTEKIHGCEPFPIGRGVSQERALYKLKELTSDAHNTAYSFTCAFDQQNVHSWFFCTKSWGHEVI